MEVDTCKRRYMATAKTCHGCTLNDVPVIYSNDAHYPQDLKSQSKWGNHAIKGTNGRTVMLN